MGKGVAAGLAGICLGLCGCYITPDPPFDPRAITAPDRVQSQDVVSSPMYPLPTTYRSYLGPTSEPATQPTYPASTGPWVSERQIVRMPIRQVMQRAAAHSAEVKVASYDPAIAQTKVIQEQGNYDPSFITNVRWDKQNDRTAGTVIPNPTNPLRNITITVENNNVYSVESGFKQKLLSGGQIQLTYETDLSQYSPTRFIRNNYWDNQLKLQLTQPLLRDFGYEVNYSRITIARNDQRISMLDFRLKLEDNTNELEKDYWQLYEAQQEVLIQEQLLTQTREMAELLWRQQLVGGKATIVEASQASAAVRQREQILVRAKAHVQDLSDDIKRRMNDPDFPVAGPEVILPADNPVTEIVHFELQDQIETAMLNRAELGQQQIRLNSAEIAKKVALNGLYPKLDFVASASIQGLSGSFDSALNDQINHGHGIYSVGLQLEIPLGNRAAWGLVRQAQLQQMQAIESYRNLGAQVSEDVKTAWREVDTTWNELRTARDARFYQERVLTGLNQRRAAGQQPLDPEFVQLLLDQQERLAESRRQEALAVSNYNIALGRMEKAKGTILRYNNIVMAEERQIWNLPPQPSEHPRSAR